MRTSELRRPEGKSFGWGFRQVLRHAFGRLLTSKAETTLPRRTSGQASLSRRAWLGTLACALAAFSVEPSARAADAPAALEYEVKAVFLFNFAKFVTWPPSAFASTNAPLVIGVMGDDPFGELVESTIQGEKVNGHPLVLQRVTRSEETKSCHLLFVSAKEQKRLPQTLADLQGWAVLTVGETEQFRQSGGMIRFVIQDNKVRFQINAAAADKAGLKISAQLLKLALGPLTQPAHPEN